jgi:hypothetical protein
MESARQKRRIEVIGRELEGMEERLRRLRGRLRL